MNRLLIKWLLLSAALLTMQGAIADNIRWISDIYDYGIIKETDGKAHGRLLFINEGSAPTLIQRVKATCGCTGVGYDRHPINPGDTATVWFDYDPAGRPGRFEKHIRVYTGETEDLSTLTIKGTVIGSPQSLMAKYPIEGGVMRLSADQLNLGKMRYGTSRSDYLHGYNQSPDTLRLSWDKSERAVSIGVSNATVAPGDLFAISFYVNSREGLQPGSFDIPVSFAATTATRSDTLTAHVRGQILPDTTVLGKMPPGTGARCVPFPTHIDLGEVSSLSKKGKEVEIGIKNEGHETLRVIRIHTPEFPEAFNLKKVPSQIKPGQWLPAKGNVDLRRLPEGTFKIPVKIVTSDPLHPTTLVYIIGTNHGTP